MGAWGHGPFDNDDACDWEAALPDDGGDAIKSALFGLNLRDLTDDSLCAFALAACEVVAAANGHAVRNFNKVAQTAREWLKEEQYRPTKRVTARARQVAAAIQSKSELANLWGESASYSGWKRSVSGLIRRLEKPPVVAGSAKPASSLRGPVKDTSTTARSKRSQPPANVLSLKQAKQIMKSQLGGYIDRMQDDKNWLEASFRLDRLPNADQACRLATLDNVTSLDLSDSSFTPSPVTADKLPVVDSMLHGWTNLKSIDASCSQGLAASLCRAAAKLPQLESLRLDETEVRDADVRVLATAQSLRELDLSHTAITKRSLAYLSGCPRLGTLRIAECDGLRIPTVNEFCEEHGKRLRIRYRPAPRQLGFKPLREEEEEALGVYNQPATQLIDQDWHYVWVNLLYGRLAFGEFLDMDRLQQLAQLCRIDRLGIGVNQSPIRNEHYEGLRFILRAWPAIRELEIVKSSRLDDSLSSEFGRFKKLKKLRFQDVKIGDATVAEVTKLKTICHLELIGTRVTKKSLESIAAMPKLRWLRVSPGRNIARSAIEKVRQGLLQTCYVEIA